MWIVSVAPERDGDYEPKLICKTIAAAFQAQARIGRDMLPMRPRVRITKAPHHIVMQWAIEQQQQKAKR